MHIEARLLQNNWILELLNGVVIWEIKQLLFGWILITNLFLLIGLLIQVQYVQVHILII